MPPLDINTHLHIPERVLQLTKQTTMQACTRLSNKARFLKMDDLNVPNKQRAAGANPLQKKESETISICLANNKQTGRVPTGVQLEKGGTRAD